MRLTFAITCLAAALPAVLHADTFGSGASEFTIDFVTIGDAGNPGRDTGYGASYGSVGYAYRIGRHEVSESMITAYNALSGGPVITLDHRGPDKPATSVSWNEAARFVNWLNTNQGYSPAYKFTSGGANDNIALWTSLDGPAYDSDNPFRNPEAHYFLPTEDEWYKAAYYDPAKDGSGGYWPYATATASPPVATTGGTTPGTAVWRDYANASPSGPADIDNAGGLSAYGTMAQGGNVLEWTESAYASPNDSPSEQRALRSCYWDDYISGIIHSFRPGDIPTRQGSIIGFRVASVPEPSGVLLSLLGVMGIAFRRRR